METMITCTHRRGSAAFIAIGAILFDYAIVVNTATCDMVAIGGSNLSAATCFRLSADFQALRSHSYNVHHFWGKMDILGTILIFLMLVKFAPIIVCKRPPCSNAFKSDVKNGSQKIERQSGQAFLPHRAVVRVVSITQDKVAAEWSFETELVESPLRDGGTWNTYGPIAAGTALQL